MYGRFGFIEVHSRQQGNRLIQETNGKIFGSQAIRVHWARYLKSVKRASSPWQDRRRCEQIGCRERGHIQNRVYNRERWGTKHQTRVTNLSEECVQQTKTTKVVQLEKVDENLDWLGRSLTCISNIPRDVEGLRNRIQNAFPKRILIRDLGKFKFLLTMESKEAQEKLINEGEGCFKK